MARTAGSRGEITGPAIRAAALRLFAQRGYAAVTMRQIAAEVGLQVGALYGYLPDKQALLHELMAGHMEALLAEWRDDPAAPAAARLRAFVRFHVRASLERADAVFLAYMELRSLTPPNRAAVGRLRRRYEDALQAILDAGLAEGSMRLADTRIAAMALIALMTGVTHWYREGGRYGREEIEAIYLGLVAGAVGLDPATLAGGPA